MIPENSSGVVVEGELTGTDVPLQIDPTAFALVMDILSNAYKDSILAFIREYATNGFDAHTEAGVTKPIEVTLPTELDLFYTIKDFGTGLNKADVIQTYALYGASTKRASNKFNGMMGIGCKAGLAYTNQFTVSAVKDGMACTIVVSKDDERGGMMTVLNEYATDEPNSVEVSIPVDEDDVEEVRDTSYDFFKYWKLGTVRINGEYPEPVTGLSINDNIMLVEGGDDDRIVMGNVPYAHRLYFEGKPRGYHIVAQVGIGDVMMAPDREGLRKNHDQTDTTIARIKQEFLEGKTKAVQRFIDKAGHRSEAISLMFRYREALASEESYQYDGVAIPEVYEHPAIEVVQPEDPNAPRIKVPDNRPLLTRAGSSKLSAADKKRKFLASLWPKTVFVTGYDRDSFTATQKKKLNKWAMDQGINLAGGDFYYVLFQESQVPKLIREWIEPSRIIDWDTIMAIKLPRNQKTASGRQPGSYDLYEAGGFVEDVLAEDIDTTNGVFYAEGSDNEFWRANNKLKDFAPKATLVHLRQNRIAKFKKLFPQATSWQDEVRRQAKDWWATVTPRKRIALVLRDDYWTSRVYKSLVAVKLDDPELRRWIRSLNVPVKALKKDMERYSGYLPKNKIKDPLDNYPLFDSGVLDSDPEHVYTYFNTAYAARKAAKNNGS